MSDVLQGADTLVRRPDPPPAGGVRLFGPAALDRVTAVEVRRTMGAQKTTTDPALVASVKAALARAAFVTSERDVPGLKGEPFTVILYPAAGDPTPLEYYQGNDTPYVRNQFQVGWWTAPDLDAANTNRSGICCTTLPDTRIHT